MKQNDLVNMGGKVLIVDDEKDFRLSMDDLIQSAGYRTDCAEDGREALEKIWTDQFDVVLLDINMPGMSGKGFLEHLSEKDYPIPVIIISGWAVREIKNYFYGLGAVSFVSKPVRNEIILALIKNTLKMTKRFKMQWKGENYAFNVCKFFPDYCNLNMSDRVFADRLLEAVNDHLLNNQFTVTFMAGEMRMTTSKFNERVKECFKNTPRVALNTLRFNMISTLIEENVFTLEDVSSKIGYSSNAYFLNVYNRYV